MTMRDRWRIALALVGGVAALALGSCVAPSNTFLKGSAPASFGFAEPSVFMEADILDQTMTVNYNAITYFFNTCVTGRAEDGDLPAAADFTLESLSLSGSSLGECVEGERSFNFSQCFAGARQELLAANYIDHLDWTNTPESACSVGSDRLRVILKPNAFMLPGGVDALAYHLAMSRDLADASGHVSRGPLRSYFIVRDTSTDTAPPTLTRLYPANQTGMIGGSREMPLPPHYPIMIEFTESLLNYSFLRTDVLWSDPDLHPLLEQPVIGGNAEVTQTDQKKTRLSFPDGLSPGGEYHLVLSARPPNYFELAYGPEATALNEPWWLFEPPHIDLSGNGFVYPEQESVLAGDSPSGAGVHAATYEADADPEQETFEFKFRVGPIVIDSPRPGETLDEDLAQRVISFRVLPNVDQVKIRLSSWDDFFGDHDYFVTVQAGGSGLLQPVSDLEMLAPTGNALMPTLSGNGEYLAYWTVPAMGDPQLFRSPMTSPASPAEVITAWDQTGTIQQRREMPLSISQDGKVLVFWSSWDLETNSPNGEGEIYLWRKTEDSLPANLVQVTAGNWCGDDSCNQTNYNPVISGNGLNVFFWTNNQLPDGSNAGHHPQIVKYEIYQDRFVAITANAGDRTVNPKLSVSADGRVGALVSSEDLDPAVGNPDHNFEVFYFSWDLDAADYDVIQVTDSDFNDAAVVVNDSPTLVRFSEGNDLKTWIYFTSDGDLAAGQTGTANTGPAERNAELFLFRERLSQADQILYLPIEQITSTPAEAVIANPAVDVENHNLAIVSNYDFRTLTTGELRVQLFQTQRVITPELTVEYRSWSFPTGEASVTSGTGPLPVPVLDDTGRTMLFSTPAALLPLDPDALDNIYTFNYQGVELGFSATWPDLAQMLKDQTGGEFTTDQVLPLGGTVVIKVESDTAGAPGFDEINIHNPDTDGDGLADAWELAYGLLPDNPDSDGDSIPDSDEDPDHDGLTNLEEQRYGTSPLLPDTDHDNMPDGWEVQHELNPLLSDGLIVLNPDADPDLDGLDNLFEYLARTDPHNSDSDNDGLADGVEVRLGTDPFTDSDRDGDSVSDAVEYNQGMSLYTADSDGDGIPDGVEFFHPCLNPLDTDSDNDGLADGVEDANHNGNVDADETDPCAADTDGDGIPDGWEQLMELDPTDPLDADEDPDEDLLTNLQEFLLAIHPEHPCQTSPFNADSDGDGTTDGTEAVFEGSTLTAYHTSPCLADSDGDSIPDSVETGDACACYNPLDPDTDHDGLPDAAEDPNQNCVLDAYETNPCLADTDGDLLADYDELRFGSDPAIADSDDDDYDDYEEWTHHTDPRNDGSYPGSFWPPMDIFADMDGDGLLNEQEGPAGTDPHDIDSDHDGLPDGWEHSKGLNPMVAGVCMDNHDNDGLTDRAEYLHDTDPFAKDTDGDGMDDTWEVATGLDPKNNDAGDDPDGDSLFNKVEYILGTHPRISDTDGDGLADGDEDKNHNGIQDPNETNPLDADSDHDGLPDGVETNNGTFENGSDTGTNPLEPDSDHDGAPDGWEYHYRFDPVSNLVPGPTNDTDNDCLLDLEESDADTSPYSPDSDLDGISDGWEITMGLYPFDPTDGGSNDADEDGLTNFEEYYFSAVTLGLPCGSTQFLDPHSPDTDGDGLGDGWEYLHYPDLHPTSGDDADADPDSDGLKNMEEFIAGTDPGDADTDHDNLNDGLEEGVACLNPLAPGSDGDGIADGTEDADHDGVVDSGETDPCDADSDDDNLPDGAEDADHDGVVDVGETNPLNPDTDGDGMTDGWEVLYHSPPACPIDPLTGDPTPDLDQDGLNNLEEFNARTNPCNPDSDGDGYSDHDEIDLGSAPQHSWIKPTKWRKMFAGNKRITFNGLNENPSICWTGSEFGVSWTHDYSHQLYFVRLSMNGTVLGDAMVLVVPATSPHIVWNGSVFGLVWSGGSNLYYTYFDEFGGMLLPEPALLPSVNAGDSNTNPSLAWGSTSFGVAWKRSSTNKYYTCFQNIDPYGNVRSDPVCIEDRLNGHGPSVAWDGEGFGVAWTKAKPSGYTDIFFNVVLNGNSWIGQNLQVSTYEYTDISPSLAWSGSEFAIVWEAGTNQILFSRISSDATSSSLPVPLDLGSTYNSAKPSLVWSGSQFAATWYINGNVIFSSISPRDDSVEQRLPIISGLTRPPRLTGAGHEFAYVASQTISNSKEIIFNRIVEYDIDGDGLDAAAEIINGASVSNWDTDGDGMDDGWEVQGGHSCLNGVTEFDGMTSDPDGDGLSSGEEYAFSRGLDPCDPDTDNDTMNDGWEVAHSMCVNPALNDGGLDFDQDGWSNLQEYQNGSDPCYNENRRNDFDLDELPDRYENLHGCLLGQTPDDQDDPDGDQLANIDEYLHHTDPCLPDTDGDGADDGAEVTCRTCPLFPDENGPAANPDGDGLINSDECLAKTDPYDPDTDSDLLFDGEEYHAYPTDPALADSNQDGLGDGWEVLIYGTDPLLTDSDADSIPDWWEIENGLDPLNSNGDDALLDPDHDGLDNSEEFDLGADPWSPDSDLDGFRDGWELDFAGLGFDPMVHQCELLSGDGDLQDGDTDRMAAIIEARIGTDPTNDDSDDDDMDDYWEWIAGLNPSSSLGPDGADGDPDHDGRSNFEEYENDGFYFTNPHDPDTDHDGLCEGDTIVNGCEGLETGTGPDLARARLIPIQPPFEYSLVGNTGLADQVELGGTGTGPELIITGNFNLGQTYTLTLDNERGEVHRITATANLTDVLTFLLTGERVESGSFRLRLEDSSRNVMIDINDAGIRVLRFHFIQHGLSGPVLATETNDGDSNHLEHIVRRRAYLPFGSVLKSEAITIP